MQHASQYAAYMTEGILVGRSLYALFIRRHIKYLSAANNMAYAPRITETTTLCDVMFSDLSHYTQDLYDRAIQSKKVQAIKLDFNSSVDKLNAAILFKFEKKSLVYQEVFPHGVTPYKTATLDEILMMMDLAEKYANKYKTDIGPDILANLQKIHTDFVTELDAELVASGNVKSLPANYEALRLEMEQQLLKNIGTLLVENYKNPTVIASFFDEYLIFPSRKDSNSPKALIVGPLSHKAFKTPFSESNTLTIVSKAIFSMYYYAAPTLTAPVPATLTEITAKDTKQLTAASLGAPTNKYIIFVNKDSTLDGEIDISIQ